MSIDSSIVPEIKITPPDGKLLCVQPYIRERATIDEYGNVQIAPDCSGASWDGVFDSHPWYNVVDRTNYSGVLYKDSYPPTYNVIDSTAEPQWPKVEGVHINDIGNSTDTPTEPSDLKNTKSNIRKIKPDINSELKRV